MQRIASCFTEEACANIAAKAVQAAAEALLSQIIAIGTIRTYIVAEVFRGRVEGSKIQTSGHFKGLNEILKGIIVNTRTCIEVSKSFECIYIQIYVSLP